MCERPRRGRALGEAAMAMVRDRGSIVAVVVERYERADDLGIGGAFGHGAMIPATPPGANTSQTEPPDPALAVASPLLGRLSPPEGPRDS